VNLCSNRYRFAVSFGAALVRRQVALLPSTLTAEVMHRTRAAYPDVYCISDDAQTSFGLDLHAFDSAGAAGTGSVSIPSIPGEQVAAIVFTSGSTGEPLPSPKTWGSLARGAASEAVDLGLERGTILVGTVPPQHMYGLESTVCVALHGNATLHAGRPFFPADICAELEALPRPRSLVTTPVHLQVLLGAVGSLPVVDSVLCATAPLAPELAVQAEKAFAAPLHELYGCTEAGYVAIRRPAVSADWHLGHELTLRQHDGETWVMGGHVPGEVQLGDVIERLDDWRFRLLGRMADMVKIGGKRSSIAHLDHELRSIEGVRDGAFLMPDDSGRGVARLAAFVVAPGMTQREILDALRLRIDPVFLPRPLCFVDALPRNDMGKLPRSALAAMAAPYLSKAR
jgi:acyl-coenzyme A synthetase/AMP-(fatty) acid ligase